LLKLFFSLSLTSIRGHTNQRSHPPRLALGRRSPLGGHPGPRRGQAGLGGTLGPILSAEVDLGRWRVYSRCRRGQGGVRWGAGTGPQAGRIADVPGALGRQPRSHPRPSGEPEARDAQSLHLPRPRTHESGWERLSRSVREPLRPRDATLEGARRIAAVGPLVAPLAEMASPWRRLECGRPRGW